MWGCTDPSPARLAIGRTHRCAVRRSRRWPSRRAQDRPLAAFTDGEVDGAGGAWHERDDRGLVAFADDAQGAVSAFEAEVLDVRRAGFADPQAVQPQQHRQRGVVWSKRSAVNRNVPSSVRSSPRARSGGPGAGGRTGRGSTRCGRRCARTGRSRTPSTAAGRSSTPRARVLPGRCGRARCAGGSRRAPESDVGAHWKKRRRSWR